ncbi:hypothetical protein Tco_0910787 [Tanacetum coccineum]|uniref:Uncharacterized protein n=1 Tax=Tanacetum coccineum TaxID=301880 RepID=A0ABQ5CWI5_9ASTR
MSSGGPIPALLCLIGLIMNHGQNESDCTIGEWKMDCKFFSRLIKEHLSLEPQGMPLELPLGETSFLDQKGLVHMRTSVTRRRNDTMQMSVPPIVCFKDFPKISTSSSISTLKQKQFGTTLKCFWLVLNSQKKTENLSYTMSLRDSRCFQNSDYFKDKMLLMQAQENGAVLDEEELLFLAGEQVGSANPQAGPSNASILSEVHILENAIDHSISNQDEHEVHNKVQPSDVIDTTSVYMGNSNVTPYEQYLSDNDISGVPSCASSALNIVCVSLVNDAFVLHDPIATELKIYKEQVLTVTEVIPFFNLLKEHFEGNQKSLVTEVRAMKAVFENLEAEVDQNETDLQSGEIERKNLLITNENLVVECSRLAKRISDKSYPLLTLKALFMRTRLLTAQSSMPFSDLK